MAEDGGFAMGYALGQDSGGGNGGWGDLGGIWGIILLAMILGWGNGGIGGGGNMNSGFAINSLDNGIRGIQNGLCDGFYAMNTGMLTGFSNIQAQMASCCCDTQRAIERGFCETNYNIANQTKAILDYLTNEKIETLRDENQTLKFQASQASQNQFITQVGSDIVNRLQPVPIPAYQVANPYASYGYGGYANCGCGCGCG